MRHLWFGAAWFVLAACGGGAPQREAGAAPKVAARPEAKAPPATEPRVDAEVEGRPDVAVAGEDWLLWWFKAGGWTTRWLRVEGARTTLVGEKKALVIGDGARLWQIERADRRVPVMGCECIDEPESPQCKSRGEMGSLGLRARPLVGGDAVTIVEAAKDPEFGDDIANGLTILGGVQGTLWVETSANGYYCGAHGSYGSGETLFDVAAGKPLERPFADWWRRIPESMRRGAAEEIHTALEQCDAVDVMSIAAIQDAEMDLDRVALALRKGAPALVWGFSVDVPYVCSPDYQATASAASGLIPEAAPLGLAAPLPAAMAADLATIGEADAFGFSRLTLAGPDRDARVAAFTAVTEAPWPKEVATDRDPAPDPARDRLDAGRDLTRSGDLPAAIAAFDAALALDAALAPAWSGRCYAKIRAGDHAGARTDCDRALGLDARPVFQAAVWFNLGLIAEATGKRDDALAAYEKSRALRDTKQARAAIAALAAKP